MTRDPLLSAWIDTLKGVAIVGVVAFHFFGDHALELSRFPSELLPSMEVALATTLAAFVRATHVGSQGIHIFFFLSGFGLALSETRKELSAKSFLVRRVTKIYPAFLVALVSVVLLQLATSQAKLDSGYFAEIAVNALLIRNYSSQWISTINGNWWFVAALVPMYVVHALVRKHIRARPAWWLIAAFSVSFLYKCLIYAFGVFEIVQFDAGQLNPYTSFFANYWWEFVAGAVFFHVDGWQWLRGSSALRLKYLLGIGIALELIGVAFGGTAIGRIFNDDFFAVAQMAIWSGLFFFGRHLLGDSSYLLRVLQRLGQSSYGLYLVHHPISKLLKLYQFSASSALVLLLAFVPYLCISWAVGWVVDRLGDQFGVSFSGKH